jgi:carbamoylphosphate synthase small subunit
VLLSNGPGDPAATGEYAVPEIQKLVASGVPVFGICLGHQMLALALGAKTVKMDQGHHGANHPVKDLTTGKVEIVSMNHGFTVDRDSLPVPGHRDPRLAVRRHQRRHRPEGQAGVQRPAPPGSLARPDRQPLPVRALRRPDGRGEVWNR